MQPNRPEDNSSRHIAEVINPVEEQDLYRRKDVFIINDIAFVIPPTSISVQQEDLSYDWKVLRSPATTKVPTGHGAIRVAITIPFLNNNIIDFHRLRTQISHNPFAFVENRFLRESIIPEEPGMKAMAFGIDSFDITNMQGSSDGWVVQLGMTWFNYAPYGPNLLFREEWETVDMAEYESLSNGSQTTSVTLRKSIGWHLPEADGKKVSRPSITYRSQNKDGELGISLPTSETIAAPTPISILEMERMHQGFEWDLLPKVSMMRSSDPRFFPSSSRIYTRFYNYIQRDALWRNFDIDIEQMLKTAGLPVEGFFGVWDASDSTKMETWGLHTGPVMASASLEERLQAITRWADVMKAVRVRMMERNGKVHFGYNLYKEIILPPEWGKSISDAARISTVAAHSATSEANQSGMGKDFVVDPITGNTYLIVSQSGSLKGNLVSLAAANPIGLGSPIGTFTKRLTFGELAGKSGEGIVARKFGIAGRKKLAAGDTRIHMGWDLQPISGSEPTYVYPVKSGKITKITRYTDITKDKTIYFTGLDRKSEVVGKQHTNMIRLLVEDTAHKEIFLDNPYIQAAGVKNYADPTNFVKTLKEIMKVGDFLTIRAGNVVVGMFWCNGASQGNTLNILHDDGSTSIYMHLDSFLSNVGPEKRVSSDTPIAIMGSTGTYGTGTGTNNVGGLLTYLAKEDPGTTSGSLEKVRKQTHGVTGGTELWNFESFGRHLHVEYREPFKNTSLRNPQPFTYNGKAVLPVDTKPPTSVLVDLKSVFANAENKAWVEFPKDYSYTPNESQVKQAIETVVQQDVASEKIDLERLSAIASDLAGLIDSGWYSYGGSSETLNIYYRTLLLSIFSTAPTSKDDDYAESQTFLDTILTGIRASCNAVISRIPMLGHEFPTLQYLGSNEPTYAFEFALIDQEGTMDGLSTGGVALQSMRARLQRNSRIFREVPNSWGVLCDTFLTRFMGTFRVGDDAVYKGEDDDAPEFLELKKRFVISRAEVANVEGNPGLSYLSLEMSESNDFDSEALLNTNSRFEDVEVARGEVLRRIHRLEFAKSDILALSIAEAANERALDVTSYGFGEFQVTSNPGSGIYLNSKNQKLVVPTSSEDQKIAAIVAWLIANDSDNLEISRGADAEGNLYFEIDPISLGLEVSESSYSDIPLEYQAETLGLNSGDGTNMQDLAYWPGMGAKKTTIKFGVKNIIDNYGSANLSIAYRKAFDIHMVLQEEIRRASLTLSEDPSRSENGSLPEGGLTIDEVRNKLYGLPVVPSLWNTFLTFQMALASRVVLDTVNGNRLLRATSNSVLFGDAVETFTTNAKWPIFGKLDSESQEIVEILEREAHQISADVSFRASQGFGAISGLVGAAFEGFADGVIGNSLGGPIQIIREIADGSDTAIDGGMTGFVFGDDFFKSSHDNLYGNIADLYMLKMFWSSRGMIDLAKSIGSDINLGAVNALIVGESGYSPLDSTRSAVRDNIASTGYWSPFRPMEMSSLLLTLDGRVQLAILLNRIVPSMNFYPARKEDFGKDPNTDELYQIISEKNQENGLNMSGASILASLLTLLSGKSLKEIVDTKIFPDIEGISKWGSPMAFKVNKEGEERKLAELKREFSSIADTVLNDYEILKLLGLEAYSGILSNQQALRGTEAYPDMLIPAHPFYGDSKDTSPDFYYWNVYEDGQILSTSKYERIVKAMEAEVAGCYETMNKLQGGIANKLDHPMLKINNSALAEASNTVIFGAEATDGASTSPVNVGPTAIMFYNNDGPEVRDFEASLSDDEDLLIVAKTVALPQLVFENTFEEGGVTFTDTASPVTEEQLQELDSKMEEVGQMFGSRSAYLASKAKPGTETEDETSPLSPELENTGHTWSLDSLKGLARDSTKDIFSQKMSMARAFPTFKLFFVEEDEIEDGLLSLDDFYSYSGVKEFTCVMGKESPADMAVITLQNVSGVLDGTKKGMLSDLDYFDRKVDKMVGEGRSTLSTDVLTEGTNFEQPFGSVVLRPGLNVQLRCGYSNDPRNLAVLISGRIVDLSWNKNNDLAEIVVQSFAAELLQVRKSPESELADAEKFRTTHHLLSHLMLSPELVHFGRWEVGQIFQNTESKDARLDFTNYSREGLSGRFKFMGYVGEFLAEHAYIALFLSASLVAMQLMPAGRTATRGLSNIPKVPKKAGAVMSFIAKMLGHVDDLFLNAPSTVLKAGKSGIGKVGDTIGRHTEGTRGSRLLRLFTSPSKKYRAERAIQNALVAGGRKADDTIDITTDLLAKKIATEAVWRDTLIPLIRQVAKLRNPEAVKVLSAAIKRYKAAAKAAKSMDELTDLASSFRGEIQTVYASTRVLNSPGVGIKEVASAVWGNKFGTGVSLTKLGFKTLTYSTLLGLGASGAAGVLDTVAMTDTVRGFNERYLKYLGRFFDATKVSFMISPQDDNLFCPHPKDYMKLKRLSFGTALRGAFAKAVGTTIDPTFGTELSALVTNQGLFDKRVDPRDCVYVLNNSTIWEVFEEMTLRHPGWAFAARPYGQAFRYTMFFGVPSQRYWSKPASDTFIKRMNLLENILKDHKVTLVEGKELYGNRVHNVSIEEWLEYNTEESLMSEYRGMAMKEYLRGMEVRFEPFRKHHHLSSWTDIVWNGLMSSESACINAVNVTYYDQNLGDPGVKGTQRVKAHNYIPEYMVRLHDVSMYRNCIGQTMARRYALGTLVKEMKKMYRGEILLTGNARIRPWDLAIMADSYNDMFGPIEIDQVVHTFSFETGFVTEIKPAAVTIANEISSWPLLEAAKIASLAMEDIYAESFRSGEDPGNLAIRKSDVDSVDGLLSHLDIGERDMALIKERYERLAKGNKDLREILGNDEELVKELKKIDENIEETVDLVRPIAYILGAGAIATGIGLGYGATRVGLSKPLGRIAATMISTGGVAFADTAFKIGSMNAPSLSSLLGGTILLLHCMREQSMMLVPLVKGGRPIVSSISLKDPTVSWKQFKGQLSREIDDTFAGGQDLINLWSEYSTGGWDKIDEALNIASNPSRITP